MIQAPAESTPVLETIVARIVSELHPRRVYLFGSRARGDARRDSDYDFLVELDQAVADRRSEACRVEHVFDWPGVEVQIHLRNPGQLERRKDDPGTVDWDAVREGQLLYAPSAILPLSPASRGSRVREPAAHPPESLGDWLFRAEEDLRLATHLSEDFGQWANAICFSCQQSAEKFLKALIIAQNEKPERTHKLQRLLAHLRGLGFTMPGLDPDCELLSRFAVTTRYPEDNENTASGRVTSPRIARPVEFSQKDAREAFSAANRIAAAVRAHLS